jgi:hypothetical protein
MTGDRNIYSCVETLREALDAKGQLRIPHPGKVWSASFVWSGPASTDLVMEVEAKFGRPLSGDYVAFLKTISYGATIFYDGRYGQWGYQLYGTGDLLLAQTEWKDAFHEDWLPHYLAVGRIIGESHPLIMDLDRPTKDGQSYAMLDGNPLDPPSCWPLMSRSFHEWLENLITAQGAKFWLWK